MKFWNKTRDVRIKNWHKVILPTDTPIMPLYPYNGWTRWGDYLQVKRDLQLNSSKGKFFMHTSEKIIWFEQMSDAVWFTIKWEIK